MFIAKFAASCALLSYVAANVVPAPLVRSLAQASATVTKKAVKAIKKKVVRAKKAVKKAEKRVKNAKSKGSKRRAERAVKRAEKRVHKAKKALKKIDHHHHSEHHHAIISQKRQDGVATILKLGRKTWHNTVWTKIAAGNDTMSFMKQTSLSARALKASFMASAPILRNPDKRFTKSQIKMMKAKMDSAYAMSLRAEEAVLIAQGRMQVGKKRVPHGIVSHHIRKALKVKKHMIAKIVKKIKAKVNKKVKKLAKHLAHKAHKHHELHKKVKHIRHKVMHAVKKMISKMHKKLVRKVGRHTAKKVAKKLKHSAARHLVIAVHKVVKKAKNTEHKSLGKLRAVGSKVAMQITKEDLRAHKSRAVAAHQGAQAGTAAVKFAAALIKKALEKKIGARKAKVVIKKVIKNAEKHAKN